MIKRRIFTFAALLLLCAFAVAGADTLPLAKEIFDRAMEKQKNLTFSAVISYERGTTKIENRFFQRKNEDGTVFSRHTEEESAFITNADGFYTVFPAVRKALRNDATDTFLDRGTPHYEIDRGSFEGRECYIVTERVEDTPELQADFEMRWRERRDTVTAEEITRGYRHRLPMIMVYYIGIDDLFIYAQEHFSLEGDRVNRFYYSEIDLDPELADSLFKVPAGYTIVVAKDRIENFRKESELSMEVFDKRNRGRLSGIAGIFERLWSIRGILAAVLAGAVALFGVLAVRAASEKRGQK